ncbi:MAG: hypothetical protein ABI068_09055 [Ktedonobacterales bacterium]
MGRERGVMRWDIHRTLLDQQLAHIEAALAALDATPLTSRTNARERNSQRERLREERCGLLQQIAALGPSPHAKMG